MNLNDMLAIPKQCVLIVLDRENWKAFVNYTQNAGFALAGLYTDFRRATNLELLVVSAGADIETLKLHTEYYRQYYHSRLCYGELKPRARKAVWYRARVVPSLDLKGVDVELVNARGESSIVGRFKNIGEGKAFIETYYTADNSFKLPVYALNSATKEFVLDKQTKLLELR